MSITVRSTNPIRYLKNNRIKIGCLHCGLVHGVGTIVEEDLTDAMTENMRRRWNEKCLGADEYSVEALETIDAREDDYVMVDAQNKEII